MKYLLLAFILFSTATHASVVTTIPKIRTVAGSLPPPTLHASASVYTYDENRDRHDYTQTLQTGYPNLPPVLSLNANVASPPDFLPERLAHQLRQV